ncbi:nucleotide pyrophosphohydrolase [Candidatus Bathyarchaeota archaeon]|nr:MAG: nucleotide pyrophosphohydrolase [Candidatus Bathyarchaeota archaeon]
MHISEFQNLMREIYFHRDSKRGVKGTYDWLVDEVRELGEALKGDNRENLEEEFADVIAWVASLGNVVGVDLEKAALKKYDYKCPRCGQTPCKCTVYAFMSIRRSCPMPVSCQPYGFPPSRLTIFSSSQSRK